MLKKSASVNYWPESRCAKAFWTQFELPPYQQLLRDTADWVDPVEGQRWIDLGCGGGQLSKMLWTKARGSLAEVVGVDIAEVNEKAYAKLRQQVDPPASPEVLKFVTADISHGLPMWHEGRFDGAVSGLAIQYAESFDEANDTWTRDAYVRILAEVQRLLRPGGTFVFSVNVPEPAWGTVAWNALSGTFQSKHPLRYLRKAWRIYSYGNWLKREARRGRFHYLPAEQISAFLAQVGFAGIECKTSFAGQAFLFRCHKPSRAA